jgi:hypothetical protein
MSGPPLEIDGINADAFDAWVRRELAHHTTDDFLPDIVIGFLRGKTIDPQDLARTLEPAIGDRTAEFVIQLWPLLLDAKTNALGVPSVILAESRAAVAAGIVESSSSSDDRERRHRHHHRHRHRSTRHRSDRLV